ncbi:MAG: AAA family ATPase [Bacteroidota bacterium]|jgi:exonuclease SbcC
MKILAIRIKNLASLDGETVIDFTQEPLSSAGIFAITGSTGAGKSTILDALCLALYAKTPRYIEAKETGVDVHDVQGATLSQGDIRAILRRGSADGFAEVDFEGTDGQQYRAQWSIRRARNKAEGTLQAYQVSLKNIGTNADLPGTKTELLAEIERLVGLSFDQFTRSVLLAQGDFTAFLKAAKDEKAGLLEKLTGTHIYSEISKRIFEKHRSEAQELRDLNLQREGIATLTAEEINALNEQLKQLTADFLTQDKQVKDVTKEVAWHDKLLELQANLIHATDTYTKAEETKSKAAERIQKLRQAELVQPVRTFVDARKTTIQQLSVKNAVLDQLETELKDLDIQKTKLLEVAKTAETDVTDKTKASEDAKPLLEEAKKIDVQLAEKKEQVAQAKKAADDAKNKYKEQQDLTSEKHKEVESLQGLITQLLTWKTENTARKPIADNKDLILSKLTDAQKQLELIDSLTLLLNKAAENSEIKEKEKEKLRKKAEKQQTTQQNAQQAYETINNKVSAIAIDELKKKKTDADAFVEELINAEAHWKLLWHSINDYHKYSLTLKDNRKELVAQQKQLVKSIHQLEKAKTERDVSLRMVDKARLAAAENVEALRNQLVPGDNCPVCGSTEHPYTTHNPQLDHVLAQLETTHKQYEAHYMHCLSAQSALTTSTKQLEQTIDKQEIEQVSKEKSLNDLQEEWKIYSIHKQSKQLPDEEKEAWLKQQLKENKAIQKQLKTQLDAYDDLKQQLEELQKVKVNSEKELAATIESINEIGRVVKSLEDEVLRTTKAVQQVNYSLEEIKETLLPIFSSGDWFEQWKKNPEKFVLSIETFAADWKSNVQQLDEKSALLGIVSATLSGLQEQEKQALADADKKKEIHTDREKEYKELSKTRNTIFEGEAVAIIEERLQKAIDKAKQTFEQCQADDNKWKTNFTQTNTKKEQTEKDIVELEHQKTEYTKKITEWLLVYNKQNTPALNEDTLENLLLLSTEWIDAERLALQAISDAVTQAQSVQQERQSLLTQHEQQKQSEQSKDELIDLLKQIQALLEQTTRRKTEIEIQLQQDETNKQKIGKLLIELDSKSKVVENWAKLNDIIGSADGKKFRQIAQEYTLDVLLSYANVHLEQLSKRYLLQRIPSTLGLQVLDQDMGNEVRTVFSLSGGESFLVSLALALGLASLSSNRMQVESLFIDEGFGSLDPNTLNIAMDALERLHNQGRKVGVISHVQEMTERIPVQIKVSKQNSGKSLVEVLG